MGAALVALIPFLVPEAISFFKAWMALRASGVPDQDIAKMVEALALSSEAKNAHALELLAGIPVPKETP